jgi:phage shock protein C
MERKLFRTEGGNAVVGGVASGLAVYFNTDVAIIRVLFVLGFFTPVPVGLAYIIMWVALPAQFGGASFASSVYNSDSNFNPLSTMTQHKSNGSQLGGAILIGLGAIFLADEFIPWFDFDKLWPLILIGIGVWLLSKNNNKPTDNGTNSTNSNQSGTTDQSYYKPDTTEGL